ncbi:MAG: nucleoside monophosphate kinase [Candidatus Vogelbacteria bacterium]|nr:nucleoside monophosphate kinase [Candidatus Vogelbacteria bacterium]
MILYGLAGSGKTTQAKLLVARSPDFEYVSASDSIRARAARQPDFAAHVKAMIPAGKLVDERELITCVRQRLGEIPTGKKLILDGVTRTKYQAEECVKMLKARGQDELITFHFVVPEAVALERMQKQQVEQKRIDSSPDAMTGRLNQYREHSAEILETLGRLTRLVNINGDQSREKVFADLTAHLRL